MRAMVMTDFGGPEVLVLQDFPEPDCGPGDLLIRVHAAAINPVDCKTRMAPRWGDRAPPMVLGFDASGVVEQVGSAVEGFAPGDAVYCSPALLREGAYAELVAVDARVVARKPETLSHVEAAAIPLAILTAWEALHDHARIQPGERVLIQAGAGGVGHFAIQLAKEAGCTVVTTAGYPESMALCRELCADEVIDYTTQDPVEAAGSCDVVFDCVGGEVFNQSIDCLGVGGRLVTIVPGVPGDQINKLFGKNASLHFEFMGSAVMHERQPEKQAAILAEVATRADAGKIKPHVSRIYTLEEIPDAHRQQESQRTLGKLVVGMA